jgi:hypothetical protein
VILKVTTSGPFRTFEKFVLGHFQVRIFLCCWLLEPAQEASTFLAASLARSARVGQRRASSCGPIPASPREVLMAWCEANRVDYVFGLARNPRLVEEICGRDPAGRGGDLVDR